MKTCIEQDCHKEQDFRGRCREHYNQFQKSYNKRYRNKNQPILTATKAEYYKNNPDKNTEQLEKRKVERVSTKLLRMDFKTAQTNMKTHGLYNGAIDGFIGPQTVTGMMRHLSANWQAKHSDLPVFINQYLEEGKITTPLRLIHFLAQCCEESARFSTLEEIGSDAYFTRYENRMGNNNTGDGAKYKGRGLIMVTGKDNYEKVGKRIGDPLLVNYPDQLASSDYAAHSAVVFWADNGLNALADADDVRAVTKRINGGVNGLHDREEYTELLKDLFR